MDDYELSNKRARIIVLVLLAAVVVLISMPILGSLGVIRIRPSLKNYQEHFGFSLEGVKVKITAYDNEPAFQDPWWAYVAEVSGDRTGTLFDPVEFSENLGQRDVTVVVELIFKEMSNHKKGRIFTQSESGRYEYRTLIYREPSSIKRSFLYVIHDLDADNYCIIRGNTIM